MVVNSPIIGDFGLLVNQNERYNGCMYALASHLLELPVVSLQTGETVATVSGLIIDPDRLQLMAFRLHTGHSPRTLLTLASARQLAVDCVIVDDEDELSEPDDVIRLQDLLKNNYTPMASSVHTESGHHLGSVEDFTINIETEQLQKLYIKPPVLRAWYKSSLIIDRSQIIDVQPRLIVVRDAGALQISVASSA